MTKVEELTKEREKHLEDAKAIQAKAKDEDRELTTDEAEALETHVTEAQRLRGEIEAAQAEAEKRAATAVALNAENEWSNQSQTPLQNRPAPSSGPPLANPNIVGGEGSNQLEDFGEWLHLTRQQVVNHVMDPRLTDDRLLHGPMAISGMGSAIDSEGGFLIPVEYRTEILRKMYDTGAILSRVRRIPISGDTVKIPYVNETSRVAGSRQGGVRGYWGEQGGTLETGHPKFGQLTLEPKKCHCLGYVTEEMIRDYGATATLLMDLFRDELIFTVEDSIINGTGSGMPLGIQNADCLVSITKETNQTADTVWGANIAKMYARMYLKGRSNAIWLYNQDVEPQLEALTLEGRWGSASTAVEGIPISMFYPAGSLWNQGEYNRLKGRPAFPIEYAATLGDVGDIILFDPSQYLLADKGGVKTASSIHVKFTTDEQAFRVTYRVDGRPWWSSAVTPFKGTNTVSPCLVTAAR